MAMENKRIIQLSTERLTLNGDDYVMVDSATDGSAKYRLDRLKETDSTLSVSDMPADAAATGQAISDEAEARANADNALDEDIDDLKSAIGNKSSLNTDTKTNLVSAINEVNGHFLDGIDTAVENWLDNHPEATTTVQDGSLTLHKFKDGEMPFVTPEMFGAKGDGITDDTQAWQAAVDSGFDVKATKKEYKCGQINVTKSINIDFNHANVKCTSDTFLKCYGAIDDTIQGETDYNANEQYAISNSSYSDYTGYAMLRGSNNFEPSRSYYLGGFVCEFKNGQLCTRYPIDVVDTVIDIITPITVTINGLDGVIHSTYSAATKSIWIVYGLNCEITNITSKHASGGYFIHLEKSFNSLIDNINVKLIYGATGTNSYIVGVIDSSFTSITNSSMYNPIWDCISTGGVYLCYHTLVNNCVLGAYDDHENARNSIIMNSVVDGCVVTAMSVIENISIVSQQTVNKPCLINIIPCSDERFAIYTINNVKFLPDNSGENLDNNYVGILIAMFPQVSGGSYYIKSLDIKNTKELSGRGGSIRFHSANSSSYTCTVKTINIDNTNLNIHVGSTYGYDAFIINNYKLNVRNITDATEDGSYPTIGASSSMAFNDLTVENSKILRLMGIYVNVVLHNVETHYNENCTISGTITGGLLKIWNLQYLLNNATSAVISDVINKRPTEYKAFNLIKASGNTYYQEWESGVLVTKQLSS